MGVKPKPEVKKTIGDPKNRAKGRTSGNKAAFWLQEKNIKRIRAWMADGCTIKELANRMGIDQSYLTKLRQAHSELEDAVSTEREIVDYEVEEGLYKSAKGFMVQEKRETITVSPNGEKTKKVEVIDKFIPPSAVAQIFWLKNRKPQQWRDKRDVSVTGSVDVGQIERYLESKDEPDS